MNTYYQINPLGEEEFYVPGYFSIVQFKNRVLVDLTPPPMKNLPAYDSPGEEDNSFDKVELAESCLEKFIILCSKGETKEAMLEAVEIFDFAKDELEDVRKELEIGEYI